MKRILITGANGFIGRALCDLLIKKGYVVNGAVRTIEKANMLPSKVRPYIVGDIGACTDWRESLMGVNAIVHLAARVHIMKERTLNPLKEFRRINTIGTARLAQMAVKANVHRLIYVSSIKVHGEQNADGPFTETELPCPQEPYALSKWEAEQALHQIGKETGLEVVIIRLPLVYGPGVAGNFLQLLHWVKYGVPLPLAGVKNYRSFIGLENLAHLLMHCIQHPQANGETFLASDGKDLSTPTLIHQLALAFGRPNRLFFFPESFLRIMARILRREKSMDRLFGSLTVDSQKVCQLLDWAPPLSTAEGLRHTVYWYLSKYNKKKCNIDIKSKVCKH